MDERAAAEAARKLIEYRNKKFEGGAWLAESPPRFDEAPICIGCGAQARRALQGTMFFNHNGQCPAFDLALAVLAP